LTFEQNNWLSKNTYGIWRRNSTTGKIDVEGGFSVPGGDLMGVRFGKISEIPRGSENYETLGSDGTIRNGDFEFSGLDSFEGCPEIVEGSFRGFYRMKGNLKTLVGGPKIVGRSYSVHGCQGLQNLEGAPESIKYHFEISGAENLTSLKGAPKFVGGKFGVSPIFETSDWSLKGKLEILKNGTQRAAELILTSIPVEEMQAEIDSRPEEMAVMLDRVLDKAKGVPGYENLKFPTDFYLPGRTSDSGTFPGMR
jgi:hypothetical protein